MQIISLELEDVKSYAQARVEFRSGVNAIVGTNGAGKSTILEAIGFALFDHLGYKQQDFVREGKNTATIAVTLQSSADDRHYQVVRRCGSSNQHYVFDPELDGKVCEGKADVLTFLREHMGVEPSADLARLFSDAVGVPQGTFTAAFLMTPAQRKGAFDPLLQVDEYKKAFDSLREPLATLKSRGHALAVDAAGLQARLEQLPDLDAALRQRAQELNDTAATLDDLTAKAQEADAVRVELESRQQTLRELQQRSAVIQERRSEVERRRAAAQQALAEAEAAAAAVAEQQAGHDAYLAAQAEQQTLDQRARRRQSLRDELSAADKTLSLVRSRTEQTARELSAIVQAEQEVVDLLAAVNEQARLEEALAAARQAQTQRQELEARVARQSSELDALRRRAEQLATQLEQARQLEGERAQLESGLPAAQRALDALRESLGSMRAEADAVKEQTAVLEASDAAACPVCEQPLTAAHRAEMLTRNADRLTDLRTQYGAVQRQVDAANQGLEEQRKRLQALQQALMTLPRAAELTDLRSEVDKRSQALTEDRRALVELAVASRDLERLTAELQELGNPREQRAIAAAQAARRADVEQQRTALRAELNAQSQAIAALRAELQDFADLDAALADNQTARQAHEVAYQTVLRNRQLAERTVRHAEEAAAIRADQAALAEEDERLSVTLAEAEATFDAQRFADVVSLAQRIHGDLAALKTRRSMLENEQRRDEETRARLAEIQARLDEIESVRQSIARQAEVLEALRSVLREAGPYITATLIRQVSDGAARLFADLMQDYTRHLTWTETYDIVLDVNGAERQFSQLSGGEQMSAALAVRLALLREMSSIDIAFFDEPTTNLDEARRDALAQQILNVKGLRQLFVISHDDTFEQATQNLIRVERVGGQSRIVSAV